MSSKTASGAQSERQVTVPLHDNLVASHYKLTVAALSPADLFHQPGPVSGRSFQALDFEHLTVPAQEHFSR